VNLIANAFEKNQREYVLPLNLLSLFGCLVGGTINVSHKSDAQGEINALKYIINECESRDPKIEPSELQNLKEIADKYVEMNARPSKSDK